MATRDESYILGLCDDVLGLTADRQHRFDFLRGDFGTKLPVDAYYEELKLVIEYRELQHTEAVPHFDRRPGRSEQRKRYDQKRREALPKHGILLVELDYKMFPLNSRKRLKRDRQKDEAVLRERLSEFLSGGGVAFLAVGKTVTETIHIDDDQNADWLHPSAISLMYGENVLDDLAFCEKNGEAISRLAWDNDIEACTDRDVGKRGG